MDPEARKGHLVHPANRVPEAIKVHLARQETVARQVAVDLQENLVLQETQVPLDPPEIRMIPAELVRLLMLEAPADERVPTSRRKSALSISLSLTEQLRPLILG